MMSSIKAHFHMIKISFAARMAYRGDFLISTFIMLIVEFLTPLITLLIYRSGASFPGWSLYEAMLIQGVFLLSKGIANPLFFGMVGNTVGLVSGGTLDLLLLRPRSTLHMIVMTSFDSEDMGKLLGGIVLFSYSLAQLPPPGILQWCQFLLLFVFSQIVLFSFAMIMSGTVIKWVGNGRVYEMFSSISSFGQYPVSIFSKPVQNFITIMIPVAMMGFFPASVLMGRPSSGILWALASSVFFLAASLLFWKFMLNKYTSAGG